jgi:hypothetical protein
MSRARGDWCPMKQQLHVYKDKYFQELARSAGWKLRQGFAVVTRLNSLSSEKSLILLL